MSDYNPMTDYNPINTMFDMQRTVLDQQQAFVNRTFDAQRRMLQSMDTSMDVGRNMESQTRHMAKAAVDATIETMERSIPGESQEMSDLRDMIDQQLEAGESLSDESWSVIESQLEETIDSYESVLDESEKLTDDLYETYLGMFEQLEETVEEAA